MEKKKRNVFVVGCNGRMGQIVCKLIQSSDDLAVTHGCDKNTVSQLGINVDNHPTSLPCPTDVIIDFSNPSATMEILPLAVDRHVPMVIATTDFSKEQEESICEYYASYIPIFKSANMSYGVNAVNELLKLAAKLFYDYDPEICEFHHRNKKDSPSGTANMFFNTINEAQDGIRVSKYGRTGKRETDEIGIASLRGGAFPGEHVVTFAGENDFIRIEHFAYNPSIFADGALQAARYIMEQSIPGIYTMKDMLGL